jgi:hypothetical protein
MSEVLFRLLTLDECSQVAHLSDDSKILGIAYTDSGEVVSMVSFSQARSGLMCDNCVGICAQGGIIWTRPDYQEQGLFTKLFYFTSEAAQIKKIYIHDGSPSGLLVADRYGFAVPKNDSLFSPPLNTAVQSAKDFALAAAIEEIL